MRYRHSEFDLRSVVIERQFIPRTPLWNTKDGTTKDLEDLSCVWGKSDNAHPCFSGNTDHIIADVSRTIIDE
jgi:hypothetical protein